jgi:hypothetical protein
MAYWQLISKRTGLGKMIYDSKSGQTSSAIKEMLKNSMEQAWMDFIGGNIVDGGLSLRFNESAYNKMHLVRRSMKYTKRKMKLVGHNRPYVSMDSNGNSISAIIQTRGIGWNIHTSGSAKRMSSTLSLPGAKKLNFISKYRGGAYLRQFLGLSKNAAKQGRAIQTRALQLFAEKLQKAKDTINLEKAKMKNFKMIQRARKSAEKKYNKMVASGKLTAYGA